MALLVYTSTVLDHSCVWFTSSVGRASEQKSEDHGFKSQVRLTLYIKSKNLTNLLGFSKKYVFVNFIYSDTKIRVDLNVGSTTHKFRLRWNNYKENNRKTKRGEEHMQSLVFEHFSSNDHHGF